MAFAAAGNMGAPQDEWLKFTRCRCGDREELLIAVTIARTQALTQTASRPRLRHDPYIGAWRFPALRIGLFGFLVGNRARNDDVLALLPIDRRGDLVLGCQLKRV